MFRQIYVGATGMDALEKDMMVITDNVSNSKTVGFKRSRVEMENLFPQVLEEVVSDSDTDGNKPNIIEYGSGVRVIGTPKDFTQGTMEITSNPYDLAIEGTGFFAVRMQDGSLAYTRAGNFHRDDAGNIVDPNGHLMEPALVVPQEAVETRVDSGGKVYIKTDTQSVETLVGQVYTYSFSNPAGLEGIGQNLYVETDASGVAIEGMPSMNGSGALAQYTLEGSNVDIVDEMMRMIVTQRAFEIITKAIQTGESMLRSAIEVAKTT